MPISPDYPGGTAPTTGPSSSGSDGSSRAHRSAFLLIIGACAVLVVLVGGFTLLVTSNGSAEDAAATDHAPVVTMPLNRATLLARSHTVVGTNTTTTITMMSGIMSGSLRPDLAGGW